MIIGGSGTLRVCVVCESACAHVTAELYQLILVKTLLTSVNPDWKSSEGKTRSDLQFLS